METRANYILIGAFTLAGAVGIVAFFLWFAQLKLDQQFAYYDVEFTSVAGLSNASDVRFAGLPVGRVVQVRLSPDNSGTIQVRLEINADTPVRQDSIATIESQGVTGVAFVGISPGTPQAPRLTPADDPDDNVPNIKAGRSTLQTLSEDAPKLLDETLKVVQDINNVLSTENQQRVSKILTNVENASDEFAQTLKDFSSVTGSVSAFATQVEKFNKTLSSLTGDLSNVLESADDTIKSIGELSEDSKTLVADGSDALVEARTAIADADTYIKGDLTETTRTLRETVADLGRQVDAFSADASQLMETFGTTGETATARLTEARKTLTDIDGLITRTETTLGSIDSAAGNFDSLLTDEGRPLVTEARTAVAEATKAVQAVRTAIDTDLPGIVADIRKATDTAARVATEVGQDLSSASGKVDTVIAKADVALTEITETFAHANETLDEIYKAMDTADRTLTVAESTFKGADRVINDDISGITADLRQTLAELNGAIDKVSAEIPGVTENLRSASASAERAFAEIEEVVRTSGGPVETFARTGLPLYTRLAGEARTLIDNLNRLTQQISRDPTRFLLDRETPVYKRR